MIRICSFTAMVVFLLCACTEKTVPTKTYFSGGFSVSVPVDYTLLVDTGISMYAEREIAFRTGASSTAGFYVFAPDQAPGLDEFADEFVATAMGEANQDSLRIQRNETSVAGAKGIEFTVIEDYFGAQTTYLKVVSATRKPVTVYCIYTAQSPDPLEAPAHLAAIIDSVSYRLP